MLQTFNRQRSLVHQISKSPWLAGMTSASWSTMTPSLQWSRTTLAMWRGTLRLVRSITCSKSANGLSSTKLSTAPTTRQLARRTSTSEVNNISIRRRKSIYCRKSICRTQLINSVSCWNLNTPTFAIVPRCFWFAAQTSDLPSTAFNTPFAQLHLLQPPPSDYNSLYNSRFRQIKSTR